MNTVPYSFCIADVILLRRRTTKRIFASPVIPEVVMSRFRSPRVGYGIEELFVRIKLDYC